MIRKGIALILMLALLITSIPMVYGKSLEHEKHDVKLWSALRPLDTTVSFMNTGAHPDDERSHLLAYLSRGLGVRTASVIANRGEGGQNQIGNELGNALGIIRSREMIEASKVIGVDLFILSQDLDDPIYDFGFSKSAEETLEKWGEEIVYERLIRVIRQYRPDILFPSFRDVDTEHGHHRAITQLTLRAFEDAANPEVFPEHIEQGLKTWQPKKLYLLAENEEQITTVVEIGEYDPIYEMTYPQLGEESRYLHKSQGMGRYIPPGPFPVNLELVKSVTVSTEKEDTLFDGIDYNFSDTAKRLKGKENVLRGDLLRLQKDLEKLQNLYPDREKILKDAHRLIRKVRELKAKVEKSSLDTSLKEDLSFKLTVKEQQLIEVSQVASSIDVETMIENPVLVRNKTTEFKLRVFNGGKVKLQNLQASISVPEGFKVEGDFDPIPLVPNQVNEAVFRIKVPGNASYFHPYEKEIFTVHISYEVGGVPVTHTFKPQETIAVLPYVGLTPQPSELVINNKEIPEAIPIGVSVQNFAKGEVTANVYLKVPDGWKVSGPQEVSFKRYGEIKNVTFMLNPSEEIQDKFDIQVIADVNGEQVNTTVQKIQYDHIGTSYYLYSSDIQGVAFDLAIPEGLKVGYVESGFDTVADELQRIGMDVTKLTEQDLKYGDLSQFDTIVLGIRAYLVREDLEQNTERLLEYVRNGGHLIVQYHTPRDNWNADSTPPYRLVIGTPSIRWRVTDENAKVNVLKPDHPLFNWPNQITENDWENWVQERGLYFPMEWADEYETFITMADPNEEPFESGILLARYGEGTYLYTNLVWYRQIQNQVPGGYRIFTNLISYPLHEEN